MKNIVCGIDGRLDIARGRKISEPEDIRRETIQNKIHREKRILKIKSIKLCDNFKSSNIHVTGVHEGEEENNGQKFSKLNDNYKTTDPRSSVKPSLKKHE